MAEKKTPPRRQPEGRKTKENYCDSTIPNYGSDSHSRLPQEQSALAKALWDGIARRSTTTGRFLFFRDVSSQDRALFLECLQNERGCLL